MEDRLIGRVFTELDNHSKRLEDLSEVVHTNAATLSLVSKLVVGLIIIMLGAGASSLHTSLSSTPNHHKPESVTMTPQNIDKVKSIYKEGGV